MTRTLYRLMIWIAAIAVMGWVGVFAGIVIFGCTKGPERELPGSFEELYR